MCNVCGPPRAAPEWFNIRTGLKMQRSTVLDPGGREED
jgi:hypothetical protein